MRNYTHEEIHEKIRRRYAEISCSVKDRFKYPTGKRAAEMLGYDLCVLERIPDDVSGSFCGVGNPFVLGPVNTGDAVLDVGCGAGIDLIFAAHSTGPDGIVCGIDLVPEMVNKAVLNAGAMGLSNCEVVVAGVESIPYEDGAFDVIISNGALYLSPLKETAFREIYRVLKPGGRLQFADVVLKDDLPEKILGMFSGWSG